MVFGILEDGRLGQQVPGTALLSDTAALNIDFDTCSENGRLKRAADGNDIILVPQPSDDPKDPLNWPKWKKECHYWSLCLAAGLAGSIGHLLNAGFKDIASEWGVSVNTVAGTNADLSLALGIFTLLQGSLGIKIGRRPVFLFASACQFFTCIWAAKSANINSFKVARVFQGFGMAPYEALAAASIGDIFFVHERGKRVAVWNFAIGGGIAITPIVNGPVINTLGWRWTFWIIMVMFGVSLLTAIFLMPETMYDRNSASRATYGANFEGNIKEVVEVDKKAFPSGDEGMVVKETEESTKMPNPLTASHEGSKPKTFLEELKPWSCPSDISLVKALMRPFPFAFSPAVWFTFFAYGCTTVWLVVVSVIYSLVFGSAPYFFDAETVGLISIGPFVGSVLGTIAAGPMSDWSVKWAARRNNGIYEPEFRLFLLIPMFILDIAGYVGWAIMQPRGLPWIGPVVMYSMISGGQCIGATAICSYLIDVHRKNAPECFALVNFAKNMVLYAITLFVNGWVINLGILRTFGILAAVTAFCVLTGIPMYVFGKKSRSFVARHPRVLTS